MAYANARVGRSSVKVPRPILFSVIFFFVPKRADVHRRGQWFSRSLNKLRRNALQRTAAKRNTAVENSRAFLESRVNYFGGKMCDLKIARCNYSYEYVIFRTRTPREKVNRTSINLDIRIVCICM